MTAKSEAEKSKSELWDIGKVVLQAVALAFFVRIFLFQPFNIPSGSMEGTLLIGDYLFVSKYSYGYSKYSLPWEVIPFSGRVMAGEPARGDIAVFRKPTDTSIDYIKRVIGLPGDEIQMKGGVLYINGTAVPKEKVEDFVGYDRYGNEERVPRYQETLPNGAKYYVLDAEADGSADDMGPYTVPPKMYFMMGDNRDNSQDSRFNDVGFVPIQNFIGRAEIIFFSSDEGTDLFRFWELPWRIRWSRFFDLTR